MKISTVFVSEGDSRPRIPSAVVTPDGTVYAFTNLRINTDADNADETRILVRRKQRGGDWEDVQSFGYPGWSWMIGAAVCDETTGKVMCLFRKIAVVDHEFFKKYSAQERNRLAYLKEVQDGQTEGNYILETCGDGFAVRKTSITPNPLGHGHFFLANTGFPHGSGSGITKRFGDHVGRLILPARFNIHETNTWEDLTTGSTNTVVFSDDHGESWHTGGIVEPGTGEGCLAERSDGSLCYNSRSYFGVPRRRCAVTRDCGETFSGQRYCDDLIEPNCNADMVRCDWEGKSFFLFSNPHSETDRVDMTLSLSTDEGETWKQVYTVNHRKASYSSLCYDRQAGIVYLLFECGDKTCIDENDLLELPVREIPGMDGHNS